MQNPRLNKPNLKLQFLNRFPPKNPQVTQKLRTKYADTCALLRRLMCKSSMASVPRVGKRLCISCLKIDPVDWYANTSVEKKKINPIHITAGIQLIIRFIPTDKPHTNPQATAFAFFLQGINPLPPNPSKAASISPHQIP